MTPPRLSLPDSIGQSSFILLHHCSTSRFTPQDFGCFLYDTSGVDISLAIGLK